MDREELNSTWKYYIIVYANSRGIRFNPGARITEGYVMLFLELIPISYCNNNVIRTFLIPISDPIECSWGR